MAQLMSRYFASWIFLQILTCPCAPAFQTETEQDIVGLLDMEAILCPTFLISEEIACSLRDLPWVTKGKFKPLLIKEAGGCKNKERAAKKQQGSLEAGPSFSLRDADSPVIQILPKDADSP